MDKKRELLAKALMDTSKTLLISMYLAYFINPSKPDYLLLLTSFLVIIGIGFSAWYLLPGDRE